MAKLLEEDMAAIRETAAKLGISPAKLAQAIEYETNGTFSPTIWGGEGGKYRGLIQMGEAERKQYGYSPDQTFAQQVRGPVYNYLLDRGIKPGMGMLDIYSTINAGRPGKYGASDKPGYDIRRHVQEIEERPYAKDAMATFGDTANVVPAGYSHMTEPDEFGRVRPIPQGQEAPAFTPADEFGRVRPIPGGDVPVPAGAAAAAIPKGLAPTLTAGAAAFLRGEQPGPLYTQFRHPTGPGPHSLQQALQMKRLKDTMADPVVSKLTAFRDKLMNAFGGDKAAASASSPVNPTVTPAGGGAPEGPNIFKTLHMK